MEISGKISKKYAKKHIAAANNMLKNIFLLSAVFNLLSLTARRSKQKLHQYYNKL